jgi:hypothetical protein
MFWIALLVVVLGLAGLAAWRRRGRSSGDLIEDQRDHLAGRENQLRTRGHPGGHP